FLRKAVRKIAETWSGLRATDKTSELRVKYPGVGNWLDSLQEGWQKKAEKLLERIATMEVGKDDEDMEESRKTLLRHAIFGFERLRLRGDAEELERALGEGVDALLRLLADRDALEASLYRDIVGNRLEVIKELERLVAEDQKERVLQKYLFDHLWLLDPAWERATGSPEMEKRLRLQAPFKDDDETKDSYGRIDIRYRTVAGKQVIVDLKKVSVRKGIYELAEQGAKYVDAMKGLLPPEEKDRAYIEVVFVVGQNPPDSSSRIEDAMNSVAPGSRIVTYDQLITRASQGYAEYLDRAKTVDLIDKLLET
ncbi:MAG: ATP-binding protein, partial [Deltaproteobacteria bacterium]|nr:ATP-binding protein [Deltaproteobacteria bacterium]